MHLQLNHPVSCPTTTSVGKGDRRAFIKELTHEVQVRQDVHPVATCGMTASCTKRKGVKQVQEAQMWGFYWASKCIVLGVRCSHGSRNSSRKLWPILVSCPVLRNSWTCYSELSTKSDLASPYYQLNSVLKATMWHLLQDCAGVVVYLSDIEIFGTTKEQHCWGLCAVLKRMTDAGLVLNTECVFSVQEIRSLDTSCREEEFNHRSQFDAITQAQVPRNIEDTRSFLGLASYYACFVPCSADIVEPLCNLLWKGNPFHWSKEQHNTFSDIKWLLGAAGLLFPFHPQLPVIATTDESDYGIWAVMHTAARASRTLSTAEQKCSTGEREALVWECKQWHVCLWANGSSGTCVPVFYKRIRAATSASCMLDDQTHYNVIADALSRFQCQVTKKSNLRMKFCLGWRHGWPRKTWNECQRKMHFSRRSWDMSQHCGLLGAASQTKWFRSFNFRRNCLRSMEYCFEVRTLRGMPRMLTGRIIFQAWVLPRSCQNQAAHKTDLMVERRWSWSSSLYEKLWNLPSCHQHYCDLCRCPRNHGRK